MTRTEFYQMNPIQNEEMNKRILNWIERIDRNEEEVNKAASRGDGATEYYTKLMNKYKSRLEGAILTLKIMGLVEEDVATAWYEDLV